MYTVPDDRVRKGKHRGYKFSEVYQFCPEYLEFAIEFWNNFVIDMDKFNALPRPTPYLKKYPVEFRGKIHENLSFKPKESSIPHAYEFLASGGKIKEVDYSFPSRIIRIQNEKIQGIYKGPPYQYENEKSFSVDRIRQMLEAHENAYCWHCNGTKKTGCLKGYSDCNKFEWIRRV
jgi:hypothetical protein